MPAHRKEVTLYRRKEERLDSESKGAPVSATPGFVSGERTKQAIAASMPRGWARMLANPEWQPDHPDLKKLHIFKPRFSTPAELLQLIDDYCDDCRARETLPTSSGLSLAMGLSDRLDQSGMTKWAEVNDSLLTILKYALARVSEAWEERLAAPKQAIGAIFWLKNHGWQDERTMHGKVQVSHDVGDFWSTVGQAIGSERATIEADCVTLPNDETE